MQKGIRLSNSQRQKSIIRLTAITAGITLIAGIGFFVVSNFSNVTESIASGNLMPRTETSDIPNVSIRSISPNPFEDDFLIEVRSKHEQSLGIFLYDMTGRRVAEHTTEYHSGKLFVNMNPGDDLPAGIYTLTVIGEDMIPHTSRVEKM